MNRRELIAYASSFVSFLLEQNCSENIRKILLFGSVARGTFDDESDVDLFIDVTKNIEKEVQTILSLFLHSRTQEVWEIKGVKNPLSLKVGNLDKWGLKRDILNDSLLLYGKYSEHPEKLKHMLLLHPRLNTSNKSKHVRFWRALYGYKQKVGSKTYLTRGLVEKSEGERISSAILVPVENKKALLEYFNKNKIRCILEEFWKENPIQK